MDLLSFREQNFLSSIYRFEKIFGRPKGFVIDKNGSTRSKRVARLIELGYLEMDENGDVVVSEKGKIVFQETR